MFPSHRILYSADIVEKFSRDLSIERSTSEYILAKNLSRVGFVVNDLIAKEAVGSTREHTCAAKVERMNVNIVEKTLRT
jgi:hypothetical protein